MGFIYFQKEKEYWEEVKKEIENFKVNDNEK
jgi:hypothetical protein